MIYVGEFQTIWQESQVRVSLLCPGKTAVIGAEQSWHVDGVLIRDPIPDHLFKWISRNFPLTQGPTDLGRSEIQVVYSPLGDSLS